jgi:hypothetical protein
MPVVVAAALEVVVAAAVAAEEAHPTVSAEELWQQRSRRLRPREQPRHRQCTCSGYDARHKIDEIYRKKATEASDNDNFPAYSARLRNMLLLEKFKPLGISKYDAKQDLVQWLRCYAMTIENAGGNNDAKCLFFPFCLDQAPLTWLESLKKNSIDKWDQLKAQFTSNFAGAIGRSGTRMDLAMVKQEQVETLHQYMRRFFDKRATVVDITDKEVIDLFQDGLYHRRTFEDFGRRPSSITKLKDMITSWANEEDKANVKYDSIRGKSEHNTSGNNNNNKGRGGATITTTRVPTTSASQTTQSRLYNTLRRTTRKRPLAALKACSKRSARGIWTTTTPPSSATNSGEHSRTLQTHDLLTIRRARRRSTKATVTSRNPTRQ